jgi:hypothetical protein
MTTEPKVENMDGDGYLAWMWKVEDTIRRQAAMIRLEHREWAIAAFNCNYDPEFAARVWMRKVIDKAPGKLSPEEEADFAVRLGGVI